MAIKTFIKPKTPNKSNNSSSANRNKTGNHPRGGALVKDLARINEKITVPEVRLIDANGEAVGIVPIKEALKAAEIAELDLVEIAPQAAPPVCRIMNYGKYCYQESKKAHEAKTKQKRVQVKEIKFRPATDDADYQVKVRNILRFLKDGDKVRVSLRFRGREIAHQEFGVRLMEQVIKDTEEFAALETKPQLEGRQLVMQLGPISKKKPVGEATKTETGDRSVEKSVAKPAAKPVDKPASKPSESNTSTQAQQ